MQGRRCRLAFLVGLSHAVDLDDEHEGIVLQFATGEVHGLGHRHLRQLLDGPAEVLA